jgi:universal stress protein E
MDELKSILVVASRSPSDYSLLEKAQRLARGCDAHIDLYYFDAHGAGTIAAETETVKAERLWQERIDDHLAYLEALQGRLRAPQIPIAPHVVCAQPLSDAILAKVAELQPDLVMKAPAGSHPLRLFTMDLNDWRLARGCPSALMLVAGKPWRSVPHFGALIDVREEAIARLPAAVLHSCEYLTLGCGGELDVAYCEPGHDGDEVADRAAALESLVREFHIPSDRVFALRGDPDSQLTEFVARQRYDVLAIGAPSHRRGLVALAGGLSSKLVDAADSDLLLVRLPARPLVRAERQISARAAPESSPTTHRP